MAEPGSADKYAGLSDKDRKMMGMGAEGPEGPSKAVSREEYVVSREAYAKIYQYTPRELQSQELLRMDTAVAKERQREWKMEQLSGSYDSDTAVRVRDMQQEGASEEEINAYKARREANKEQFVAKETQGIMELWERQAREMDIKQRIADMERYKPKNEAEVLSATDHLWNDIDQALNYRPEQQDASEIDKNWGQAMLKILNELRDQLRFEKSFPSRMVGALIKAEDGQWDRQYSDVHQPLVEEENLQRITDAERIEHQRGQKKWIEPKWKRNIDALIRVLGNGEKYTETPDDERKRRAERDRAVSEYQAGEIRKQV